MSKRIVLNCSKHRNGAYGIVMRGVQKCTCAGASLRGRKSAPLCCIKLDTATDTCTGTGGFLMKAMETMLMLAKGNEEKETHIREEQLIGFEIDPVLFALACSNMFLH